MCPPGIGFSYPSAHGKETVSADSFRLSLLTSLLSYPSRMQVVSTVCVFRFFRPYPPPQSLWLTLPWGRLYEHYDIAIILRIALEALLTMVGTGEGKGWGGKVGSGRRRLRCWVRKFKPKSSLHGFPAAGDP
jgi:hypothetical protein